MNECRPSLLDGQPWESDKPTTPILPMNCDDRGEAALSALETKDRKERAAEAGRSQQVAICFEICLDTAVQMPNFWKKNSFVSAIGRTFLSAQVQQDLERMREEVSVSDDSPANEEPQRFMAQVAKFEAENAWHSNREGFSWCLQPIRAC